MDDELYVCSLNSKPGQFFMDAGRICLRMSVVHGYYMRLYRQDNVCRAGPFLSGLPPLYEGAQA
jgi:hypothetical protein